MKGNELKPHIGIFGRRNAGKSSLVNYLTGQSIAIVSDLPGTTTDPVKKSMEIGGIGPVVLIDTAGVDDTGDVGQLRINSSRAVLPQCNLALILFRDNDFSSFEEQLVCDCQKNNIPFLLIHTQQDRMPLCDSKSDELFAKYGTTVFPLSVNDDLCHAKLLDAIRRAMPETAYRHHTLLGDVVTTGDVVVLVTPIDSSAPEGRMILPQVQVLRDLLDHHAEILFCQPEELEKTLNSLKSAPRLVVTDSQAYAMVSKIVPEDVFLTSFSVVLARAKGLFPHYVHGTPFIDNLRDGDKVLLLESCTHNVTCEDIGRVKLPKLLAKYTGCHLQCETMGGSTPLPNDIGSYKLVIQCGGCNLTAKQLSARLAPVIDAQVPVSNYGLSIAYMNGIFKRSMLIFNNLS